MNDDFTEDVKALVKKYKGRAYSVVVDTPDAVLVRGDRTTPSSLNYVYINTVIMLRNMEEDSYGYALNYHQDRKKENE